MICFWMGFLYGGATLAGIAFGLGIYWRDLLQEE